MDLTIFVYNFPHIAKQIFESLDEKSLIRSSLVCSSWRQFIHSDKFFWIKITDNYGSGWVKFIEFVRTKKVNSDTFCTLAKSFMSWHLDGKKRISSSTIKYGLHPMFAAICLDDLEIFHTVRKLLPNFMDPVKGLYFHDNWDIEFLSPFYFAAKFGSENIVKWFIGNFGYKKAIGMKIGPVRSPLFLASRSNHSKIVQILFNMAKLKKIKIENETDAYGMTLLHLAARNGYFDLTKALLKDYDRTLGNCGNCFLPGNENGATPLHEASKNGHISIVELILKHTCSSYEDDDGETPLHLAAEFGHFEIVKLLLHGICKSRKSKRKKNESLKDIDLNPENGDKRTPLHLASKNGHLKVVQELFQFQEQIRINCEDKEGKTPLHLATEGGHIEVVKTLLSQIKFDINLQDTKKRTPLHEAAENGHFEIVQAIFDRIKGDFLDLNPKDCNGRTPLGLASDNGHYSIVHFLSDKIREKRLENDNSRKIEDPFKPCPKRFKPS